MSYVDEVIESVVAKNPAEPEFHQAVKEVLNLFVRLSRQTRKNTEKSLFWREW